MSSIDYGRGLTNIDHETGIRYGVIHANEVCQAWADSSESDYGPPTCGKCGNEAIGIDDPAVPDLDEDHEWDDDGRDYACAHCQRTFDSEDAYGCEPLAWTLDDGEYKATQGGDDCDIFILKSPFYTRAEFCSPCAPGACYLMSPDDDGAKAYCFGHDWFEDGKAPYPVFRVADDSPVLPE
jgi:hypothetical protein